MLWRATSCIVHCKNASLRKLTAEEAMFVKPVCIAALAVAATSAVALRAEAAPLPTNVGAMKAVLDPPIVQVRYGRWGGGWRGGYRGWGYRGWGHRGGGYPGWGMGAAAVGGAIASSAYYGGHYGASYPYYGGGYGYGGGYAPEYCPPYGGYYRGYYGW
jgi:hypothetical protein